MSLRGFRLLHNIMAQKGLSPFIQCEQHSVRDVPSCVDIATYIRKIGKTDYHLIGTCKASNDDTVALAPALKVRGRPEFRSTRWVAQDCLYRCG